jgi:peroxiredoxin Q/BCP
LRRRQKEQRIRRVAEARLPDSQRSGEGTAKAYGVVHEGREVPERWTFYIDKDGVVKFIDKKVSTKSHGEDIAKKLEELGVAKKK